MSSKCVNLSAVPKGEVGKIVKIRAMHGSPAPLCSLSISAENLLCLGFEPEERQSSCLRSKRWKEQ